MLLERALGLTTKRRYKAVNRLPSVKRDEFPLNPIQLSKDKPLQRLYNGINLTFLLLPVDTTRDVKPRVTILLFTDSRRPIDKNFGQSFIARSLLSVRKKLRTYQRKQP